MSKHQVRALVALIIIGALFFTYRHHSARKGSNEVAQEGTPASHDAQPGAEHGSVSGSRGVASVGTENSAAGGGSDHAGTENGNLGGGVRVQNTAVSFSGQGGVNAGNLAVGAPTTGNGTATTQQLKPGQSTTAPVEAPPSCYTLTFHHKHMLTHNSDEACSQHKNLIKLGHEDVNLKSVCVRVNGTPVRYQTNKKHKDELLIGAIAGPDAKITARFCTGKLNCSDDCAVPKDEFMDAIGASEDGMKGGVQVGNWDTGDDADKTNAKLNHDLKRELADIEDSEPGVSQGTSIFRDWLSDPEAVTACAAGGQGLKQAKADGK